MRGALLGTNGKRKGVCARSRRSVRSAAAIRPTETTPPTTWFTMSGYAQVAAIFPVFSSLPRAIFQGSIRLSGLFQISQAFMQVEIRRSPVRQAYAEPAQWK